MNHSALACAALTIASMAQVNASDITVFDAARDCQALDTTQGIRYLPPCDFNHGEYLFPDIHRSLSEGNALREAQFKTTLNYTFRCESMRPLSISYALLNGDTQRNTATVSGTPDATQDVDSFTHDYDKGVLLLNSLNGVTGIQAAKPGCHMTIHGFASYPEPGFFQAMVTGFKQVDGVLTLIYNAANPSLGYAQALAAIDNGIMLIGLLGQGFNDPLTQKSAELTLTQLQEAKTTLTHECSASQGASNLCTQALTNTQNTIAQQAQRHAQQLDGIYDYLSNQIQWLESQNLDTRGDLEALKAVKQRLEQE